MKADPDRTSVGSRLICYIEISHFRLPECLYIRLKVLDFGATNYSTYERTKIVS